MEFQDNGRCFVCGHANPHGLRLTFEMEGSSGVRTQCTIPEHLQGFAGIAHGGVLAMILDECMVNAAWLRGTTAVTARFEMRLRHPVAVGERVTFHARIIRASARGVEVESHAARDDATVVAEAKALLIRVTGQDPRKSFE